MSAAAMPAATSFVQAQPVAYAAAPVTGSVTYAAPISAGSVTYAAPTATYTAAPTVTYAAAPIATSYTVPAGSVTYAAAPITSSVTMPVAAAGSVTGSVALPAGGSVTYAAPAPIATPLQPSQESFVISPERFQRILAGQPLSQAEIAQLTQAQGAVAPAAASAAVTETVVPKVQTAVSNRSLASVASEEEPGVLQFLNESPYISQAERADKSAGKEAFATLPIELSGKVPADYQQGTPLVFKGPDGDMEVEVPAGMNVPIGETVTYRLQPQAELRIRVPEGRCSGEIMEFKRADGLEIQVKIPEGVEEGDYFDADPPAAMVKVPENTAAGEYITFQARKEGVEVTDWCRVAVPQNVAPGKFFIARLPPPEKPEESSGSPKKKSSKKKVKASKKEKGCC